VLGVGFEHTPGRRDPRYLGDATALDALVTYRTPAAGAASSRSS
jgi:hypothetical protein